MGNADDTNIRELLQHAHEDEPHARREINTIVTPMIQFQTDRFCRRFCQGRFANERCTLTPPHGPTTSMGDDTPLCDKANASYAWMLEDLTNKKRLSGIKAESKVQLIAYFKTLVNSLPFYERWKNWRFERRVHVPTYIVTLAQHASAVFLQLRSGNGISLIAQSIGLSETETHEIADQVLLELTKRRRLYLLKPHTTIKFSEVSGGSEDSESTYEPDDHSLSPEVILESEYIRQAWEQLDDVEQYVIEALVIEEQDANHVLKALGQLNISLKKGQPATQNNRQQLYYYKRKALEKLCRLVT